MVVGPVDGSTRMGHSMDERSEPAQARRPREVWELVEEVRQVARALEDFQDPSQEWRRLFAELFGTFLPAVG